MPGFGDIRPGAANVFPFVPPEGITVSRLAELARVRKQSMAQAVDQLERTGYVERRPNPRDHRSRLVFLTGARRVGSPSHARGRRLAWQARWAQLDESWRSSRRYAPRSRVCWLSSGTSRDRAGLRIAQARSASRAAATRSPDRTAPSM